MKELRNRDIKLNLNLNTESNNKSQTITYVLITLVIFDLRLERGMNHKSKKY